MVIVDDWIEIKMAAQTSVMIREIKKQVDILLQKIIIRADTKEIHELESVMIEGLCKILAVSPWSSHYLIILRYNTKNSPTVAITPFSNEQH